MQIPSLPHELYIQILSYLPLTDRISTAKAHPLLCQALNDPNLWKSLIIDVSRDPLPYQCYNNNDVRDGRIPNLPSLLMYTKSLTIPNCDNAEEGILLNYLVSNCCNVTSLSLERSRYVSDSHVLYIFRNLPHLSSINLSYCNITHQSLKVMAQIGRYLRHLDLSFTTISDKGLLALSKAKSMPLATLKLSGCPFITINGVYPVLLTFISNMTLEHLDFSKNYIIDGSHIFPHLAQLLNKYFPFGARFTLNVLYCEQVTVSDVEKFNDMLRKDMNIVVLSNPILYDHSQESIRQYLERMRS